MNCSCADRQGNTAQTAGQPLTTVTMFKSCLTETDGKQLISQQPCHSNMPEKESKLTRSLGSCVQITAEQDAKNTRDYWEEIPIIDIHIRHTSQM